ncbi:MAG TPA: TetR/AcrR family transcriptional regulator [Solirubrobacteraceae bacterium]
MSVPELVWADLDAASKRERLLAAAGEVFAQEGIEAPMPSIAAAAGAGIGSVYRQFPSKEDLLAALVVRRLQTVLADIDAAIGAGGDPWLALRALLSHLADRQASDDVVAEAMATVSDHPEVIAWSSRCEHSLEALIASARAQGSLRADATHGDVRLLLSAVRAARRQSVGAAGWKRMLELGVDGLAARR